MEQSQVRRPYFDADPVRFSPTKAILTFLVTFLGMCAVAQFAGGFITISLQTGN
jgi:hypothetical protein